MESHDSRRSIEELSTIFSEANFAIQSETETNVAMNEEYVELDIGIFVTNFKQLSFVQVLFFKKLKEIQ